AAVGGCRAVCPLGLEAVAAAGLVPGGSCGRGGSGAVRRVRAAESLARVSGLTSWPLWAADILARASGLRVRPFRAAESLARVSGHLVRPVMAAAILARCSGLIWLASLSWVSRLCRERKPPAACPPVAAAEVTSAGHLRPP